MKIILGYENKELMNCHESDPANDNQDYHVDFNSLVKIVFELQKRIYSLECNVEQCEGKD